MSRAASSPWTSWLVLLWFSGIAALSLRALGGWVLVETLRRQGTAALPADLMDRCRALQQQLGVTRPVRFLQSLRATTPVVVGWLRPVILLPVSALAGLSPQQLDALILHELAHIRRHDALINAMLLAAETLLFYHPAVWWVSRRIRIEREHCCDDLAVGTCGDAALYVEALATLEAGRLPPSLALAAGGRLKDRAARLLGVPSQTQRYSLGAISGLAAVTLVAISVALAQPGPAQPAATQVEFAGNKAFDANTLRAQLRDGERSARGLPANGPYNADRVAYDGELLGHFYTNNGYADAKISSAVTGGGAASHVTFTVEEGRQYRIGKVTINPTTAALLTPMLSFKSGDIFDASKVKAALDAASPDVSLHLQRDPGGKPVMNVAIDVDDSQHAGLESPQTGSNATINLKGAVKTAQGSNQPAATEAFMVVTNPKQPPIDIRADRVRNDAQGRPTQFEGNAIVRQGGITVRADSIRTEVTSPTPAEPRGRLTKLFADGDVVVTQDGKTVHATHLEADIRDNKLAISLSGGVTLDLH